MNRSESKDNHSSESNLNSHRDSKGSCDFYDEGGGSKEDEPCIVDVSMVKVSPSKGLVSDGFTIDIDFNLSRDVVAGNWVIKFLVDLTNKRLIKIIGETPAEDYAEGDNDMSYRVPSIDLSGITPSTLANSGLLMACFIADGQEVISINVVVNVKKENGTIIREFLNPM